MLKKLKLSQDWTDAAGKAYKSGDVIEADEATAKQLTDLKMAVAYDEAAEKLHAEEAKKADEIAQKAAEKAVAEALKNVNTQGGMQIHVVADQVDKELDGYHLGQNLLDIKSFQETGQKTKHLEAMDVKTVSATGLNETIDSEGGHLVGADSLTELSQLAHKEAQLMARTRRIPIGPNSNRLVWQAVDESSRASGSRRGGLSLAWTHENVSSTASKPSFRRQSMELEKLTGHFAVTEELNQDAIALGGMIRAMFGEEFGFEMDDVTYRGTGAGQPEGILNAAATVEVAAEGGQGASTIVKANIDNMWSRMWAGSLGNASWYVNQDTWPQLLDLNQTVGTGGAAVFLPPGQSIASAPLGTLYGRPIEPIEQASTLGTVGDIVFADLSQYWTIEKGGLQQASSIHVRFLQGEELVRFTMRLNGRLNWRTALTPANGTNTQSPVITLATRA